MRIITLIAILFFLAGCEKPKEHGELQTMVSQALETEVSAEFEILDFSTNSALGDYVETYRLKFSPAIFSSIELATKESTSWEKLPSGKVFQLVKKFEGHGFNEVIATISPESQEIRVQFVWE